MDDDYNTGYPYKGCDGHDKLISVPNGDARGLDERFISEKTAWLGRMEGDIHTKNDQVGSGRKAQVASDLEKS